MVSLAVAFFLVAAQRLLELRVARRNEAWALEHGAREFAAGHYPLFFVLHGAWLVGWVVEGWARGPAPVEHWQPWLLLFVIAQILRYASIKTLGRRWNTRILVFPGLAPIRSGIYRFVRHPNYFAVIVELAAVPLFFGAWITAISTSIANLLLLFGVRIPAETRALKWAAAASPGPEGPEEAGDPTGAPG